MTTVGFGNMCVEDKVLQEKPAMMGKQQGASSKNHNQRCQRNALDQE